MSAALPEPGAKAPDFTLPRDGGSSVSLSALAPAPVVLFFYPKASTPGCTTEALEFTAALPAFRAAGAEVLGVSRDSLRRQESFRDKHALGVPLLTDETGEVCNHYGVWGEKKNYGKSYMGITRTTFLIGGDGTVLKVWPKVRVKGHVDEVLAAVQAL